MTETAQLWTQDFQAHTAKGNESEFLHRSAASVAKNPISLTIDWWKLSRAPGKLNFNEYLDFQVYDQSRFENPKDRRRFLSDDLHWKLCYQCSDRKWDATTEDKWISETLLRSSGINTTQTIGVLGGPDRAYPNVPRIENADQLRGLITDYGRPVFAKLNGGIGSEGATRISMIDTDRFQAAGMGEVSAEALFQSMRQAPAAYLLQEELEHHAEMKRRVGDRISTIRAMTFISDNGIRTPFTILKMPASGNVADNFWRDGNLLADIDQNTGRIRRVIRGKGPKMEILEKHPDTQEPLTDTVLPDWAEVQRLIDDVARLYAPVKYQSLDIALTDKGPAIVEINTGGSFYLPQIATGRGLLTDEFIDTFRACGAEIDSSKI